MPSLRGRVWQLGDGFGCHRIVPNRFDFRRTADWAAAEEHLFEESGLDFADRIGAGDLLLAGTSFGRGHAHYHLQAVKALQRRGIGAVFAVSFNAIFQRTAINEGFPAWAYGAPLAELVGAGDELEIDLGTGLARNTGTGGTRQLPPVAEVVREILDAGGLEASTLARLAR
ncbi:3-isopropylmalate dehydratase small subunit [Pseudonocardia ailaonensis]|uniref:Alpha-IPM isomerase n=1 Tax=Pseudonocardia ailaonensis TaxID=367279 RepID=A0ABN2N3A2_9PSEU